MYQRSSSQFPILTVLRSRPQAIAQVSGSEAYPQIAGTVRFYQTKAGVILYEQIKGLPAEVESCHDRVFGCHIHSGTACCGNAEDPFADAGTHYNPDDCEHPYHAGDLPPLFGNNGFALSLFLTDRFTVKDVIGRTIIIHDQPDDFTTQPSGNAGQKIACGIIQRVV